MASRTSVLSALVLAVPVALSAQNPTTFVVRLGQDTTGLEQFTNNKGNVTINLVNRSPRLMRRQISFSLDKDGAMTRAELTNTRVGAPAGSPPAQHTIATFGPDSMRVVTHVDTNTRKFAAVVPHDAAVPVGSLWVMYDILATRLIESKKDSLHLPMAYLGSADISWVALRKVGKDSLDIQTEFDRYTAKVDGKGHIVRIRPITGTQQYSVDRVDQMDLAAFTDRYAAMGDKGTLGIFSPRDTSREDANGAHLWIDYGRPSVRGREIFGKVVPYGEIWRTGANAATQIGFDKPIAFGGTVVPAGKYTLWTIPGKDSWTLLINSETGQWGTEHKPEKDLYKIPMSVSSKDGVTEKFFIHIADENGKGQIHFVWDKTVLAVDYAVQ